MFFGLLLLIFTAAVNYYVDPASLFGKGNIEEQAAHLLAQEHIIAGLKNSDERLLQKFYIQDSISRRPNHIVLGSSRAMFISGTMTGDSDRTFFNSAVSGASLEDILAIYYLWEESGSDIREITIEVALDWFNEGYTATRWEVLESEYENMLIKLGQKETKRLVLLIDPKYKELFSPSYLQSSIKEILGGHAKISAEISDSTDTRNIRYPDGSIRYPLAAYEIGITNMMDTRQWIKEKGLAYSFMSERRKNMFENIVNYWVDNNIKVNLFINAYDINLYTVLEEISPAMERVNSYLEKLSDSSPFVTLYGSFNPKIYGLTGKDFLDIAHPREHVYELILSKP